MFTICFNLDWKNRFFSRLKSLQRFIIITPGFCISQLHSSLIQRASLTLKLFFVVLRSSVFHPQILYPVFSWTFVLSSHFRYQILTFSFIPLTPWADSFLRSRQLTSHSKFSQHFMKLIFHCRVFKSPPLISILNQINSVHTTLRSILTLSSHVYIGLPSVSFLLTSTPYSTFSFTYTPWS
jgi:hypothetical protein